MSTSKATPRQLDTLARLVSAEVPACRIGPNGVLLAANQPFTGLLARLGAGEAASAIGRQLPALLDVGELAGIDPGGGVRAMRVALGQPRRPWEVLVVPEPGGGALSLYWRELDPALPPQLAQLQGDFLNTVSHELCTPLAAMVGYLELLEDPASGPLNATQHEYVTQIGSHAQALRLAIDCLLDVTRLRAGQLDVCLGPVRLDELAAEVAARLPAGDRARLQVHIDPALPPAAADHRRLAQVVEHLCDNALKFSEPDSLVGLAACLTPAGELELTIEDRGSGIPPEAMVRLFTPFFQAAPSLRREQGGLGLGLVLSRQLVEAQGGRLELTSEPAVGTRVTLTLPVWQSPLVG